MVKVNIPLLSLPCQCRCLFLANFAIIIFSVFLTTEIKIINAGGNLINRKYTDLYDASVDLYMCDDTDENSKSYCDCKNEEVVSCDFSKFPSNPPDVQRTVHMTLIAAYSETVKKICICGAPNNLEIRITSKFLAVDRHSINRVDIYQMDGPMNVPLDFQINFSGDLYIENVKLLKELGAWKFGQGFIITMTDTEYLQCCSNIKAPNLTSPAFFMQDTTIGVVRNGGINSQHLWNSVVFNRVTFRAMDRNAIRLDKLKYMNASFTNCLFQNLEENAIVANGAVNFLIAHSTFEETCHQSAIGARVVGDSSTFALIGNTFLNRVLLEVDGKTVAILFNKFTVWDDDTFSHWGDTIYNQAGNTRVVSVEFNTIEEFRVGESGIPELGSSDVVIFNENVISTCECSTVIKFDISTFLFQNGTNRCDAQGKFRHCHLDIKIIQAECSKTSSPDIARLCHKDKNAKLILDTIELNLTQIEHRLRTTVKIESEFMNEMFKFVKNPFRMHESSKLSTQYLTGVSSTRQIQVEIFLLTMICMFLFFRI